MAVMVPDVKFHTKRHRAKIIRRGCPENVGIATVAVIVESGTIGKKFPIQSLCNVSTVKCAAKRKDS